MARRTDEWLMDYREGTMAAILRRQKTAAHLGPRAARRLDDMEYLDAPSTDIVRSASWHISLSFSAICSGRRSQFDAPPDAVLPLWHIM